MCACKREELHPGISFNCISDERFKTNKLSVHFVMPLLEEKASVNALVPSLLRKGCRRFPDFTKLNQYLNTLYGAFVGSGVEKFGDYQVVNLFVSGIDDQFTLEDEKITEELSVLLSEMIFDPVLDGDAFIAEEVEIEKKSLADAILAELNEKRGYAINTATKIMCNGEPYGLNPYGTVEQVKAITPKDVYAAYQEMLAKARVEIMFVGGGDETVAKKVFAEKFAEVERSYEVLPEIALHLPKEEEQAVTERMDVSQSKMVLGFSTGIASDPTALSALRVMTAVFGGTPMSKLFLNVREKLSLCYYCAARLDRTKGIMKVDCGVENENIEKAKEEILRQLEEMKQGNITEEEISHAVLSLTNSYRTINDAVGAIEGFYIGQILTGNMTSPEEEAAKIVQVTREDIVRAANSVVLELTYVLTGKEEK